jgi:D-alanyl-D-alanine carboxypeptidase
MRKFSSGGVLALALAVAGTAMMTTPASAAPKGHERLQRVLDQAVTGDGVPGIVADVRDGRTRWFGTAGVADLETRRERHPQERFRIGSLTKAFTATVVLRLAAEGTLSLDDTVAEWTPGLAEQVGADGTAITIRHLLNHTSGIPDVIPGQESPPPGKPGAGFAYSKVNYTLAGLVVEKATGAKLGDEIARRITRPLGLTGTYLPGEETVIRGPHARHYTKLPDGTIEDVTDLDVSWAWAAGGMVSTTADIHRFMTALLGGRLLPAAQQREMFTMVPTADWIPGTRYGLGVYSQELPCGVTVWGGGGSIFGSWTYAMGGRDGRNLVVTNLNGDWNDPLATSVKLLQARFCPVRG